MNERVPSYPLVEVTMRDDGSAHVNTAGDHLELPAGDTPATRQAIIIYATELAEQLGRAVLMRAVEPTGVTWIQAVGTDGGVTDLTQTAPNGRPKAKTSRRQRSGLVQPAAPARALPKVTPPRSITSASHSAWAASQALARPTPPDSPPCPDPLDEPTRIVPRRSMPHAMLTVSTGEVVTITGTVIIGRAPVIHDTENVTRLVLKDPTRTLSKTHLRLELTPAGLTAVDLDSANGTFLAGEHSELTAGTPYPLTDGVSLQLGTNISITIGLTS